jgi:YD repeat-containing protein
MAGALMLVACAAVNSPSARAQSESMGVHLNDSGVQPGRVGAGRVTPPAAFSGMERPDTASFLMSERLLTLPGRGLNVNLDMSYDSSLYQLDSNGTQQFVTATRGHQSGAYFTSNDSVQGWPAYGFSLGLGTLIIHNVTDGSDCSYSVIPANSYCPGSFFGSPAQGPTAITYIDATGARHRFEDGISVDSTDLRLGFTSGAYTITSTDGTKIIFGKKNVRLLNNVSDERFCPGNGIERRTCPVNDVLYFATKIIDRNGNFIQINYSTYGPHITSIVDTLDRVIEFQYDSDDHLRSILVPGFEPNTKREVAHFHYELMTRVHSFANQGTYNETIKVLTAIRYPGTRSGKRYYYSSYGMIYKVEELLGMDATSDTNITGTVVASTEYNYPLTPSNLLFQLPRYTTRTDKWIGSSVNETFEAVYTFDVVYVQNGTTPSDANLISISTVTAPDQETVYRTTKRWYPPPFHSITWDNTWDEGLVLEETVSKGRIDQGGKLFSKARYVWQGKPGGPRVMWRVLTDDTGRERATSYNYTDDPNRADNRWAGIFTNLKEVKEYDFDSQTLLRRTEYTYETQAAWVNRWLVKLPTTVKVYEGAATAPVSQVVYAYDAEALETYQTLPTSYDASTPQQRGNLTSITANTNAGYPTLGVSLTSRMVYDVLGNLVRSTDPKGNATPDPDDYTIKTGYSADFKYAYPTVVTSPVVGNGSALSFSTVTDYNFNTGLVKTVMNANDQITGYEYDDPINRVTKITHTDGRWVQYVYRDEPGDSYVITKTALDASRVIEEYKYLNGKEQLIRTQSLFDVSSYSTLDFKYDLMGRTTSVSSPYLSQLNTTPNPDNRLWTTTSFDTLGRALTMTTPDGAKAETAYAGASTLHIDPAGKQRVVKVDALGQTAEVWEVKPADPATEAISFPGHPEVTAGYRTGYTYDVLGNLRKVSQGVQRRYFAYDSLSRLIRVRVPEQGTGTALALPAEMLSTLSDNNNDWSVAYEYDENGDLKKRTDARGREIVYTYDALRRVTFKDYSDTTPDVTYFYDTATNGKGLVSSVSSSVSAYSYDAYDGAGRVTSSSQSVDGVTYPMPDYQYDHIGNITSEEYPSGRVVKTSYDEAGRVAGVKNKATGLFYVGAAETDFNRIRYAAHGAPETMKLGNGLWEHTIFNKQFQPTEIGLGTLPSDSSVLKIR